MSANRPLRRRAGLALLGLTVLTAGCTTVGPDFSRPPAPSAERYEMQGDLAPAPVRLEAAQARTGAWWTAFGSADLDAVVRQALADNPTLAEADATLAQAQSALAQARGEAGPQVEANASVGRQRANLQAFGFTSFGGASLKNPTFTLYSLGGAVGYDLDLFGGERRRIEQATARAEAQAHRAEAAYLALTANVALQAVTIATLRAQIDAVEEMIKADEANVELVRRAHRLGGSTSAAKVAAQSQLEQDRTLLPPLRAQLAAARHALALLVGQAPAAWTAPDFALSDLRLAAAAPVSLPSDLVRTRPDILAVEADLHAATALIGVTTADLYPKISLSAALTQGALHPEDLFSYDTSAWSLGAGLTAPLFNGGALKARRQQARDAALAASARYRQTVLVAFVQVADALSALAWDDEALAAYARAEGQADENLKLSRTAFEQGGGTLIAVLDAQRGLHQARASRVRAQGQRLADAVRLFVASGADWRTAAATSS